MLYHDSNYFVLHNFTVFLGDSKVDKQETKLVVAGLLELSDITGRLDALHEYLTDFLIQKGSPNVKDPDNIDE